MSKSQLVSSFSSQSLLSRAKHLRASLLAFHRGTSSTDRRLCKWHRGSGLSAAAAYNARGAFVRVAGGSPLCGWL